MPEIWTLNCIHTVYIPGRCCQHFITFIILACMQLAEMSMEAPSRNQIMSYFEKNVVNAIKSWQLTDRSRKENEEKSLNQFIRDVASSIQLKVDNSTITSSEVSLELCRL